MRAVSLAAMVLSYASARRGVMADCLLLPWSYSVHALLLIVHSYLSLVCYSCVLYKQVAVDFVSPESLGEALKLAQRLRTSDIQHGDHRLDPSTRDTQEKLNSRLMLVRGCLRAYEVLHPDEFAGLDLKDRATGVGPLTVPENTQLAKQRHKKLKRA